MPRIGAAVAVQGSVGDRERVVRGLVTGAVEGGAQHRRDGDTPNHLDLIVPQLQPSPTQPDRGVLRRRRLDGNGNSRGRIVKRGQRLRGEARGAGDGEVDVRFSRPHRQPLNQGGRGVRQACRRRQELLGGDGPGQREHEPLLPALSARDGTQVRARHETEQVRLLGGDKAALAARVDDGRTKVRRDRADGGGVTGGGGNRGHAVSLLGSRGRFESTAWGLWAQRCPAGRKQVCGSRRR